MKPARGKPGVGQVTAQPRVESSMSAAFALLGALF
jgi:hypothetical protein